MKMILKKSFNCAISSILVICIFSVYIFSDYGIANSIKISAVESNIYNIYDNVLFGDINADGKIDIADVIIYYIHQYRF